MQNGLDIVFHAYKKYAFSRIHTKKNGGSQITLRPLSDQLFIIIMNTLLKTREKDVHKLHSNFGKQFIVKSTIYRIVGGRVVVFNATFNNILVIL